MFYPTKVYSTNVYSEPATSMSRYTYLNDKGQFLKDPLQIECRRKIEMKIKLTIWSWEMKRENRGRGGHLISNYESVWKSTYCRS